MVTMAHHKYIDQIWYKAHGDERRGRPFAMEGKQFSKIQIGSAKHLRSPCRTWQSHVTTQIAQAFVTFLTHCLARRSYLLPRLSPSKNAGAEIRIFPQQDCFCRF
jgi:hypothetical protein